MSYITRDHVSTALHRMKTFHDDLQKVHNRHGLCFLDNVGRRNMLMSTAQERFFADALGDDYAHVSTNGRTGEPDIVIGELGRELECKMTSPKMNSSGINLQTDHATLARKGATDYLYVIVDKKFEKFVVLHYTGLTTDDFSTLCKSSRGKVKLMKHVAFSKCRVLWGDVKSKNDIELAKLRSNLKKCSLNAVKKREKILAAIKFWSDAPINFMYEFEGI